MAFCELQFSPNARFLVSADCDGVVRLWENDVTGNYEQLQEWNMRGDLGKGSLCIDISACSKFIVVASSSYINMSNRVVLKSVENGNIIRSLTPQPVIKSITKVMFSVDYRAVFICGRQGRNNNSNVIKLWRPYLDDTHKDNLTTLWEQEYLICNPKIIISHDKTMIAIQDTVISADCNQGWLLSLDNNYSCTVQELNIQVSDGRGLFQFTSDDECIIYATIIGLSYWNVAKRKFTDTEYVLPIHKRTMNNLRVINCSPNNRHLIFRDNIHPEGDSSLYIIKFMYCCCDKDGYCGCHNYYYRYKYNYYCL